MQKFSPLAYIQKFQIPILLGAVLAGLVFYRYFSNKQTYTASAIIEYTNSKAAEGFSPDGKKIDTSEIYSRAVMQDVFDRMDFDYDTRNMDKLRSQVVVTPILSEEEKAMQEAQNEAGEESTVKATKYRVSFTASKEDSDQPDKFARQLLDNMLDAYLADYAKNHIGGGSITSNLPGLYDGNYDYLEMIEIIDEDLQENLQSLYKRISGLQNGPLYYYRSTETGYTYMDLYRDLETIHKTDVPNIYAYILNNRASRDGDILIAKYEKRIKDYQISNSANTSHSEAILAIIDAYVRMMRESGNTDITYEYILDDVDDDYYRYLQQSENEDGTSTANWERPDETVKYDVLLEDYVKNGTNVEYDKLNIAYCQYIIGVFSGRVPASGQVGLDLDAPASGEEDGETAAETPQVIAPAPGANAVAEEMLDSVISRLSRLYRLLDRTMAEYNEYAGAANISLGSNVVLEGEQRLFLYSGIVIVVFLVLLSVMVIVLSRLGEIFHYHVYVDPKFQIANRSACDRYMEGYANRILPENFCCVSVMASDIRRKNERYGVEACDGMLSKLIEILKTAFAGAEESFISVNGLGQFIIFLKNTSHGQAESCMQCVESVTSRYNEDAECQIAYRYGLAESGYDSIYQIKMLMLKAIERCTRVEDKDAAAAQQPGGEDSAAVQRQPEEAGAAVSRRPDGKARLGNEASPDRGAVRQDSARLDQLLQRLEKARSNK